MKTLTKSDLINIETFKGLLKMLNNDIKEAKQGNAAPEVKAQNVFKLSIQRADLLQNAQKNYPQINWIDNIEESRKAPVININSRKYLCEIHNKTN